MTKKQAASSHASPERRKDTVISQKSRPEIVVVSKAGRHRTGKIVGVTPATSIDPDDAPEWTDEQLDRAEFARGGDVVRPAEGTLTRRRGRPRIAAAKEQVSVRLDPDVLGALRADGPGWQSRMNDVLRKALGL